MLAPDTTAAIALIALDALEDILDELVAMPEPLETVSDVAIHGLLTQIAEALRRDPAKMRARAARAEGRGNLERAARIRARADEVEANQS